ncbi:sodium:proton antiporter [Streptomyces abyssalis]|uniref:Na(+)/H(+) antiporter NhaA n=1 Tax=Streptomyces abyssalis TaxID=933944 RepID=A0A1E7JKU7_9ACTN|nr:Na+/H+ antiporter NhaA [Streptomyces abyssalis]OEU88239.1 sodium:proton antiporter [Streptomyces abyssalis]OEU91110.1 sodium:proton antiporter [Streptomyces abyssalis]OEV29031.1 sodium:proton antiporter [Streptomyces nanshensis]
MSDSKGSSESAASGSETGRTPWSTVHLRRFLRTETGSAAVLVAATLIALIWANVDFHSYERVWSTELYAGIADERISLDLHHWVNSGLMALFFFVVGLEARREFDMGDLRERRRVALPVVAGLGSMLVPVAIYLAFNAGRGSAQGWGTAMSTDTAFALGMLALVGPRFPRRLRTFMLTVTVVDDVVALAVIALVYSEHIALVPLLTACGLLALVLTLRYANVTSGFVYALLGSVMWVAMLESGVDPIVTGLVLGLLTYAYPASRGDLERASGLFRLFREQPTGELARTARVGLVAAISPNDRLQNLFHPWTSYVIVPLFALANTGVQITGELLARSFASPVTLGILTGVVLGKPAGVLGFSWLMTRLSGGRLRPSVGWAAVAGGGTLAGIGFTVALLIAELAFEGEELNEAKVGVLSAALAACLLTLAVSRATALLPHRLKGRALLGTSAPLTDLTTGVDDERDHIRGPSDATVTLVEYGDHECPYCAGAEPVIRALLGGRDDVRHVWRHLPLTDVHPNAQLRAEAAEAAGAQGAFWEMHDWLLANQEETSVAMLIRQAKVLGLDTDRFREDLRSRAGADRIAEDIESADESGVSGTPTFFVNGRRHHGPYDSASLHAAVRAARLRADIGG